MHVAATVLSTEDECRIDPFWYTTRFVFDL